jgi:hypothetical protein
VIPEQKEADVVGITCPKNSCRPLVTFRSADKFELRTSRSSERMPRPGGGIARISLSCLVDRTQNMPEFSPNEVADRLSMTEDDLFALLGSEITGPQALPLRPAELIERGKRWLGAQRELLHAQVCSSVTLKSFTLTTTDNSAIALEVAKLIVGILLPVNPVTLAALLVKRGLKSFCSDRWEQI